MIEQDLHSPPPVTNEDVTSGAGIPRLQCIDYPIVLARGDVSIGRARHERQLVADQRRSERLEHREQAIVRDAARECFVKGTVSLEPAHWIVRTPKGLAQITETSGGGRVFARGELEGESLQRPENRVDLTYVGRPELGHEEAAMVIGNEEPFGLEAEE